MTSNSVSASERVALREQLTSEKARLERQLQGFDETFTGMVAGSDVEPADDEHDPDGTTAYERAQISALAEATRTQLAEIDRALAEVSDDADFGVCERCGLPIGVERLEALPGTTRCVLCAAGRPAMGPNPLHPLR
jgi:DnaK suppressor protein